jgi:Xaa-Pro aminopeptidase
MSTRFAPPAADLQARRERVGAAVAASGRDGVVVTTLVNVRYLTGFTGSNGALVLHADGTGLFLTDGRYRDQALAEVPGLEHAITRDLLGVAAERLVEHGGCWCVETHTLSVDAHGRLTKAATGVALVGADRVVERARETKDDVEVAALREACRISTEALQGLWAGPLVGRTERDVARDLEWRMLELGAEAVAFETILASGPHTAVPHHHPTDRVLETGDLLKSDFGARVAGYHADCTRTVVLGAADAWQREVHAAVRASQAAGVDALREGRPVAEADAVARGVLDEAGWLEHFTTGLGHGVGLQIHEDPFIAASHVGTLERRTVLTMEPGIYVPGRGGVRIEDTVLVTPAATGTPEVLTDLTTELLEIA